MSDVIASSQTHAPRIAAGSKVKMHFGLILPTGEEIDTTRRGKPAELVIGDGNLLPGFEAAIIGMSAGDDAQLLIPAAQAFGERNEANIRTMARSRFGDMSEDELEPGLVVSFQAPDGELPGVIVDIYTESIRVDFNHPLSGTDITLDVSILAVSNAEAAVASYSPTDD